MKSVWIGNPEVWTLGAIPWQLFCTLTFKGLRLANPSLKAGVTRVTMWFGLYRRFCRQFGIADSGLLWCMREEAGELGGRMHLHVLIGGVREQLINERTCFWLMHRWEELGGGMARVRLFDSALPGVEYFLKTEISARDAYESTKIRGAGLIIVSKSVVRVLSSSARTPADG